MKKGDKVQKTSGDYLYPGVVVAVFDNLNGKTRVVVEATGNEYRGMLHIFNPEQLQVIEKAHEDWRPRSTQ